MYISIKLKLQLDCLSYNLNFCIIDLDKTIKAIHYSKANIAHHPYEFQYNFGNCPYCPEIGNLTLQAENCFMCFEP